MAGWTDPGLEWRKARASEESNCVEVAVARSAVLVRNSRDPAGQVLALTHREWRAFLADIRNNVSTVGVLTTSPEG